MTERDGVLAVLLLWAIVLAVVDWRLHKVPNSLLLFALLPTLALLAWRGSGPQGVALWSSVWGLVAGLLLSLPGYWASRLGAGDVKLAAVIGLLLGWPLLLWCLLLSALLLGAMSLAALAALGLAPARRLKLPAAVALSGGFAAVLLANREGWL